MKMESANIDSLTMDQAIKYVWHKIHKISEAKNYAEEDSEAFADQETYLKQSLALYYKQLTFLNKAKELLEKLAREKVREEAPYHE